MCLRKIVAFLSLLLMLQADELDLLDDIFDMDLGSLKSIKIDTASKSLQSLDSSPARILIVTKEQIRNRGYRSLEDLLNDLPAFQILRHADSGIINQVAIRGIMGNNYFKIMQDGIEINQSDGEILSVAMQYPLMGVERVEVLYGAVGAIYGSDTVSGVINLVSSTKDEGGVGVWVGEYGYKYIHLNQAIKYKDTIFSYKAHYHKDGDYNLYKYYPDMYQDSSNRNFKPQESKSAGLRVLHGGFEAGANYRYSSESVFISMSGDNALKKNNIADKNANLDTELINAYMKYTAPLFWGVNSQTTLSYDSTELLDKSYFRNKYTNNEAGHKYSKSYRVELEQILNKTIQNHSLTLGLSYEHYHSTPMTYDLKSSSDRDPILGKTDPLLPDIKVPIYKLTWDIFSIFAQDQISLGEHFDVALALRYDKSSEYESSLNPRVAFIHKGKNITQKLIYSQAFLAPSTYNKYKLYGTPLSDDGSGNLIVKDFRVANENLEPEKSKTFEYNLDYTLNPNQLISFSTYYTKVDGMINIEAPLSNKEDFFGNGIKVLSAKGASNVATADIYGADISFLGHSYFTGYDFDYWLSYSFVDGSVKEADEKFDAYFSSKHMLKAGSTFRYNKFSITPSMRWLSPIKAAPYEKGGDYLEDKVNGYILFNLFATYDITKYQSLSFRVDNLFDKHYMGVRYNSSSKYLSPQEGRRVSLMYRYNF